MNTGLMSSVALSVLAAAAVAVVPASARSATTSPSTSATTDQAAGSTVGELVVTAQKREQRLSDVGIAVAAFSGETLQRQGVTDASQLVKVVPGLSFFTTTTATPVYSLRGVGFNESSLAAYPAASIYVDEVPLPFPAMAEEAAMDIARVEVLKGPQGTLFGENSTAGAINFVAAAPTPNFTAGADVGYARFNTATLNGFVSGPLSDTLRARISFDATRADGWQTSYTRPGDTLGDVRRYGGRVIVDWTPTDRLKIRLNLNGWIDKSQPVAAQLVAITPATPAALFPALANYPLLPSNNARLADWSPNWGIGADDTFWQASIRGDYVMGGGVTLTSITSYAHYNRNERLDLDGMSLDSTDSFVQGAIRSFFQELRLTNAASSRLRWIVGANYGQDRVHDNDGFLFTDATGGRAFGFGTANFFSDQEMNNYAAFGNVEYDLTDRLTLKGGARYTRADRSDSSCSYDAGDGAAAGVFTYIARLFNPAAPAILPGQCFTLDPHTFTATLFRAQLNEDNVSWRVGADFKPQPGVLLYFNIAKGYKAGGFPTVEASFTSQFVPVQQESLLDFEGGAKLNLMDHRLSVEASAFYYDYRNKQLRSKLIDPVFGPLEALQNIPRSSVRGAELSVTAAPTRGLTFGFSGTYLDATIDEFTGVNGAGVIANFAGAPMPYTPKWQLAGNIDYERPISDTLSAFVGANIIHHSSTYAAIGVEPIPGTGFDRDLSIRDFTTLDLRAGIDTADGRWGLTIWGRNVTNQYYWTNVVRISDVIVRYAAMPATYGITVRYRY